MSVHSLPFRQVVEHRKREHADPEEEDARVSRYKQSLPKRFTVELIQEEVVEESGDAKDNQEHQHSLKNAFNACTHLLGEEKCLGEGMLPLEVLPVNFCARMPMINNIGILTEYSRVMRIRLPWVERETNHELCDHEEAKQAEKWFIE